MKVPNPGVSVEVQGGSTGSARDDPDGLHKYWHYLFVVAVFTFVFSSLGLLNAYFRFVNISSYDINQQDVSSSILFAGYAGMFFSMAILPIPDYVLVPAYGFLASIGIFNPATTFMVCLVAALFPIEYLCGRLAARPLLLKGLALFRITEKDIEVADRWLVEHGHFSIFMATFVPYFYSLASLAAGTLKMKAAPFFLSSTAGFGIRYVFLEYIGYFGVYIFAVSFDYSERGLFAGLLIASSAYLAVHLARTLRFAPIIHRVALTLGR
jgi:membrane protein DedA with SNARE-associated domain